MGQKPDWSYNPESIDHRCYYSREERLALTNAPKPMKRKKSRIIFMIILDVLLLFFAWQCIIEMRRDSQKQKNSIEVVRDEYIYKAVRENTAQGFELAIIIRKTNDLAFPMPTSASAKFVLTAGTTTNAVTIGADGVVFPRPMHIFRVRFPKSMTLSQVQIFFTAGGVPPDVTMTVAK